MFAYRTLQHIDLKQKHIVFTDVNIKLQTIIYRSLRAERYNVLINNLI